MPIGKQQILDEIRRTAAENGGTPLGQTRFCKTTGIKAYDWYGVHWARWSDALAEAGFTANKFANSYGKNVVLEKYSELAREMGKLPTEGELLLRGKSDGAFPHPETFRRIGRKKKLIEEVVLYCRGREGFESVLALCEAYLSTANGRPSLGSNRPAEVKASLGFVYLMKSGRFYKIGHSNAAGRREYELAIQLPEKLNTIHTIRTDDPVGIDAYWHNRFKDRRQNGEWFDLSAAEVIAFKRRKFM